jgi:hypothetical protein
VAAEGDISQFASAIGGFVAVGDRRHRLGHLRGQGREPAFFDEMQKCYGTIDSYFVKGLGIHAAGEKGLHDRFSVEQVVLPAMIGGTLLVYFVSSPSPLARRVGPGLIHGNEGARWWSTNDTRLALPKLRQVDVIHEPRQRFALEKRNLKPGPFSALAYYRTMSAVVASLGLEEQSDRAVLRKGQHLSR